LSWSGMKGIEREVMFSSQKRMKEN